MEFKQPCCWGSSFIQLTCCRISPTHGQHRSQDEAQHRHNEAIKGIMPRNNEEGHEEVEEVHEVSWNEVGGRKQGNLWQQQQRGVAQYS